MATLVMMKPAGAVIVVTGFVPFTSSQPGCVVMFVGESLPSSVKNALANSPDVSPEAVSSNDDPAESSGSTYQVVWMLPLTSPSRSSALTIDDGPRSVSVTGVRRAVVVQHLKLNGLSSLKVARKDMGRTGRCVVVLIRRHDGHHPPVLQRLYKTATKTARGSATGLGTSNNASAIGL